MNPENGTIMEYYKVENFKLKDEKYKRRKKSTRLPINLYLLVTQNLFYCLQKFFSIKGLLKGFFNDDIFCNLEVGISGERAITA